jgi:hypothetical protein
VQGRITYLGSSLDCIFDGLGDQPSSSEHFLDLDAQEFCKRGWILLNPATFRPRLRPINFVPGDCSGFSDLLDLKITPLVEDNGSCI